MNFSNEDYYGLLSDYSGKTINSSSTPIDIQNAIDACKKNIDFPKKQEYKDLLQRAENVLKDKNKKSAYDTYCQNHPVEIGMAQDKRRFETEWLPKDQLNNRKLIERDKSKEVLLRASRMYFDPKNKTKMVGIDLSSFKSSYNALRVMVYSNPEDICLADLLETTKKLDDKCKEIIDKIKMIEDQIEATKKAQKKIMDDAQVKLKEVFAYLKDKNVKMNPQQWQSLAAAYNALRVAIPNVVPGTPAPTPNYSDIKAKTEALDTLYQQIKTEVATKQANDKIVAAANEALAESKDLYTNNYSHMFDQEKTKLGTDYNELSRALQTQPIDYQRVVSLTETLKATNSSIKSRLNTREQALKSQQLISQQGIAPGKKRFDGKTKALIYGGGLLTIGPLGALVAYLIVRNNKKHTITGVQTMESEAIKKSREKLEAEITTLLQKPEDNQYKLAVARTRYKNEIELLRSRLAIRENERVQLGYSTVSRLSTMALRNELKIAATRLKKIDDELARGQSFNKSNIGRINDQIAERDNEIAQEASRKLGTTPAEAARIDSRIKNLQINKSALKNIRAGKIRSFKTFDGVKAGFKRGMIRMVSHTPLAGLFIDDNAVNDSLARIDAENQVRHR